MTVAASVCGRQCSLVRWLCSWGAVSEASIAPELEWLAGGGVRLWQRARSVVLAAFAAQRDKRFFETPECPEKARFLDMMRHDHVFGFRVSR
jgi:hypothetical protein